MREIATQAGREDFLIVTPGVRPVGSAQDDQARAATPEAEREALHRPFGNCEVRSVELWVDGGTFAPPKACGPPLGEDNSKYSLKPTSTRCFLELSTLVTFYIIQIQILVDSNLMQ